MIEAVEAALARRVAVGAHPGYFDLQNFGRTERDISGHEAGRLVLLQIEQLFEIAGRKLHHVKLHGALYNQVCRDSYLADAVVTDLARLWPDLTIYALSGSQLATAALARGMSVAQEAFADRAYEPDGSLTPRSAPGALLTDPSAVAAQALSIVRDGFVRARNGAAVRLAADTLCIHGDGPNAVAFAEAVASALREAGVAIRAP